VKGTRTCSVDGCEDAHHSLSFCIKHYARFIRYGDPLITHNNRYDDVQYHGAHIRVRAAKGNIAQYLCQHCGCQAENWAYDGKDPEELIGPARRGGPLLKYSLKVQHYMPLCTKCHRVYDRKLPKVCSVSGCERKYCANGLCRPHYKQQWRATNRR
jgi:hypothetical protein